MKKFNNQSCGSHVGLMNYGGAKFCRFALFPLMLLMLLLVPTSMVAETTTEDPRYVLFKGLEGITDVTITDDGGYPWQMLDLNADGMKDLGFTIPDGSKGLMSSNYHVDGSSSETVVNFTVEKPMLLMFKYLVSSEEFDEATITLDNKKSWTISEINQIEIKKLLSVGKHSLKLSYKKDDSVNENADRTCIYDLKTATTFSEYVADYVATNSTLTFKKITSDNLEGLDLSRMAVVDNIDIVQNVCTNYSSIKNIVFDESFKTYAPTSLSGFFYGCETLETISGLEYLNTANVEFMDNMFNGCSALKSLDLTNFNTAKVTNMGNMFNGCSVLTSLDLTNFNTANVTDMSFMFHGCSALTSLDLTKFNTAKVVNMGNMFYGCSALTSLDLTNFNTANVDFMDSMFNGCSALKSLDLTNFNTAKVVNMYMMFNGCSALESLDLTNFNTAKVTYMNNMFEGCSALTTIYASDKFDTDNVKHGLDMFTGCKSLKDYSDSKTDHTNAYCGTDGYFTPVFDYAEFDNATGTLTFRRGLSKPAEAYDLNVESTNLGWEAQKGNIKKVVFDASFANARPTNCCRWFADCVYLTEIEGIENLNTQNVTDMSDMFVCCYALTSLDVSNFNTEKVTNMSNMFTGCEELSLLDLSMFNTESVENMSSMFSGCSTLQTIFASDKFVTDQVFGGDDMFIGCENLKGFIDFSNPDKTDKTYANYKTGYFTKLVGKNGEKKIGAAGEALTTENLILEDGKDFVAYEPFAAKDASYCRDIPKGSTWGTLCLPFEVSLANQNFRAFKLLSADDATETVELEEIETSIAAGTPVIIKMKDGANSLSISEADKAIAKDVQASEAANGNYQLQGIYTQKVFDKDADNNCYIVKGNKLMNPAKLLENSSTTQVGSKPFRAYMVDKSSAPAAGARMFSIAIGGGTTAIDSLNTIADDKAVYYDLQGNRLNAPQKGINIVKRGGKTMKVIIK